MEHYKIVSKTMRINEILKCLKLHYYYTKGNQVEKYDDKRRLEICLLIQMDPYEQSTSIITIFDHICLV